MDKYYIYIYNYQEKVPLWDAIGHAMGAPLDKSRKQ
jgi:hypothetical protein